jgi:hypothetical protein
MMDNLTAALYGAVTKSVVAGKIVWTIACDPSNTTSICGIARNSGEGTLCYILRVLNTLFPSSGTTLVTTTAVPSTATSTGTAGQIAFNTSGLYVCVATNTWRKATLSTF